MTDHLLVQRTTGNHRTQSLLGAYHSPQNPGKVGVAYITALAALNQTLKRLHRHQSELLLVLLRPDILPLHTNGRENDICGYVKWRKISGGTRSDLERRCRDTFASLKKTCRKLGISFWNYLYDRIEQTSTIPPLPDIVRERAATSAVP